MKYLSIAFIVLMIGCKSTTKVSNETKVTPVYTPGPKTFVYKTKSDYNNLVPVLLNDEGTEIISYPHPNDLKRGNEFQLPVSLSNGYLLDKRGINKNVAFLKLTYQEYHNLKTPPTLEELVSMIIDKDPLIELYDCGNKAAFTDIENQLNDLIKSNSLRTACKVIK